MSLKKILEVLKNSESNVNALFSLTDDDIEKLYSLAVYHGLFSDENYGFHDRKNSVSLLISLLYALKEEDSKEIEKSV